MQVFHKPVKIAGMLISARDVQGLMRTPRPRLQRTLQRLQLITLPICCLLPQLAALRSILSHRTAFRQQVCPCSMRFERTSKALAERKLKFCRSSWCLAGFDLFSVWPLS